MSAETPSSFGPVAPYYDELMRAVPYRMWKSYYHLLLATQSADPKSLLDVCCGTGTMCEMLADDGYEIEGFDLASGMIEEARRKAQRKKLSIRYEVANAATFEMGRTYDAAYSFFDSLNNITDPAHLQSAFHRVAEHLPSGGSFIFDLNTAYAFEARLFDQQDLRTNSRLRYKWQGEWDPEERIITVHMRFWRGTEMFEETHVQRAYDDDEIRAMLAAAGFTNVRSYHSYTLDPPRFKSDRVHYAALRA